MKVQRLIAIYNIFIQYQDEVIGGLKLTRETFRLGIVAARLKLKGIDGGLYKGWSMWFNSNNAHHLTIFCILFIISTIK